MEKNIENYEKLNRWKDDAWTVIHTLEQGKAQGKSLDDILEENKKAYIEYCEELEQYENDNSINEER